MVENNKKYSNYKSNKILFIKISDNEESTWIKFYIAVGEIITPYLLETLHYKLFIYLPEASNVN